MNESTKRAQDEACNGTGNTGKRAPVGTNDINQILTERGDRYGVFIDHARISQSFKNYVRDTHGEKWDSMAFDQKEAMEMIFHKIARVLNGDPDYSDSWRDIAGYAALVADRLDGIYR